MSYEGNNPKYQAPRCVSTQLGTPVSYMCPFYYYQ